MCNSNITKAIITCGGYATRFLPISRSIPKEMLPIGNKPVIHYIMEELREAGVRDVLMLIGRGREVMQNYFDANPEINLDALFPDINIYYRRVPMPRGSADNIWHAKDFVGGEHFLVAYCDDVFFDGNPSKELTADYEKNGKPVIAVYKVPKEHTHKYGIIAPHNTTQNSRVFDVAEIVEKPKNNPPSCLASVGRFLLSSEIFELIEHDMKKNSPFIKGGVGAADGGFVCMTQQLNKLARSGCLRAVSTASTRFDTGTAEGLLQANCFAHGISTSRCDR